MGLSELGAELDIGALAALQVERDGLRLLIAGGRVGLTAEDVPARWDVFEGDLILVVDVPRAAKLANRVPAFGFDFHDITRRPFLAGKIDRHHDARRLDHGQLDILLWRSDRLTQPRPAIARLGNP